MIMRPYCSLNHIINEDLILNSLYSKDNLSLINIIVIVFCIRVAVVSHHDGVELLCGVGQVPAAHRRHEEEGEAQAEEHFRGLWPRTALLSSL